MTDEQEHRKQVAAGPEQSGDSGRFDGEAAGADGRDHGVSTGWLDAIEQHPGETTTPEVLRLVAIARGWLVARSRILQLETSLRGMTSAYDRVVGEKHELERTADRAVTMCPYGNMPREAGAGHWREWHRGHGYHLDPDATRAMTSKRPVTTDYVPDDDPPCETNEFEERVQFVEQILGGGQTPCEMSDDDPHHVMLTYANCAMVTADRLGLSATITLRITSPDGSVVTVTKESEMARRERT